MLLINGAKNIQNKFINWINPYAIIVYRVIEWLLVRFLW